MIGITILGSTGSIGTQTLDIVREYGEDLRVVAIAANRQVDLVEKQVREFTPKFACMYDEAAANDLKTRLADTDTVVLSGMDGLIEISTLDDIDMVVTVTEAASNPYYNCYETDENGFLHISKGDGCYTRRQDAPKAWEYNGAVYVINIESLKKGPLGSFRRRKMVEMSRERSVDLDTPLDWMVAEAIMSGMKQ